VVIDIKTMAVAIPFISTPNAILNPAGCAKHPLQWIISKRVKDVSPRERHQHASPDRERKGEGLFRAATLQQPS
jgi:hypothetical protein